MLTILAGLIHNIFFIYIPIFIFKKKHKYLIHFGIVIFIINILLMMFLGRSYLVDVLNQISFINLKSYFWIEMRWGFTLYWFIGFLSVFMTRRNYLTYRDKFNQSYNNYNPKHENFLKIVYILNVYMILFFPLLTIDSTFYRIIRNLYLINIVSSAIILFIKDKSFKKYKLDTKILTVVYIFTWFILEIIMNFEYIVKPIFENNLFI